MSFDIQLLIAAAAACVIGIALGWLLALVFGKRELEQTRLRLADVEARREQEQLAAREQLALLEQSRGALSQEFEVLANRIFEAKQTSFETRQASLQQHMQQQSKQSLEGLVSPLREQLQQFRQKVEQVYDTENRERASLITEIRLLKNLSLQVSEDASNLASALKGDNKAQGNWGEVILERILEQSGLQKGREYDTQVNLRSDDGERRLPDVIVRLPEGRDVVIDAKVSLVDYQRYCDAVDDAERERYLKAHVLSLRSHVMKLSDKSYQNLEGIRTLDFVMIFMPIEAAFSVAFQYDQNLFGEAFERGIVIVSPTTLLATLRTVHSIWRYEKQNRNAEKIAQEAGKLFDQFARVGESLDDLGKQIGKAHDSYHETVKRFTTGRGNMVSRVEKLKQLGARASKQLPATFSDADSGDADITDD
ncbi:MAG TPA: DNA recombination protein RmuC [Pseudomonadales bacterium]|nr:DNA recombination protein RmuC [Pseudomonadales bacterium]